MKVEYRDYINKLLSRQLSQANENLYRFRQSAKSHDVNQKWGMADETLGEIIAEYEGLESLVLKTMEAVKEIKVD